MEAIVPAGLNGFDYVVITVVGLLAVQGLMRGFTQEALSLAGWIAAILVVRFLHQPVTAWLAPKTGGDASAAIIAFLLLFFGTVFIGRMIAGAIGGAAKRSAIGPLDRLLGAGFGATKGIILASVFFLLVGFATSVFDTDRTPPQWLAESKASPILLLTSSVMVGWVRDVQADGAPDMPPMPDIPGLTLPPDHPPLDAMPPRNPNDQGYAPEDRSALDQLLDKAAAEGDEVAI